MTNVRVAGIEAPVMSRDNLSEYLDSVLNRSELNETEVILFPEKFISNVFVENSIAYGEIIKLFRELSSEHSKCIVPGSLNIQRDNGLFNTSPVFFDGELLGWQDKVIPFSKEKRYYAHGSEVRTFKAGRLKFGVQVCYDLDFPFITKMQASRGIDLILNPSLILSRFRNMWYLYVKTRSLENRIPVISVNSSSHPFAGGSISTYFSVTEGGVILKTKRASEGIVHCSVNTGMVRILSSLRRNEDPGNYDLLQHDTKIRE